MSKRWSHEVTDGGDQVRRFLVRSRKMPGEKSAGYKHLHPRERLSGGRLEAGDNPWQRLARLVDPVLSTHNTQIPLQTYRCGRAARMPQSPGQVAPLQQQWEGRCWRENCIQESLGSSMQVRVHPGPGWAALVWTVRHHVRSHREPLSQSPCNGSYGDVRSQVQHV